MDELEKFVNGEEAEEVQDEGGKKKGKGKGGSKKEKAKKEPKPRRDNVAYVNELESIRSVRKFHQTAIAKKAKSADKPEAIARYEGEIEASKARLEALLEKAYKSENVLQALIDMDEEPNKILTHYIKIKEAEFDKWVEHNEFKVPKSALKNMSDDVPAEFLKELPLDLHEVVVSRHEKSDFRLRALCKKFNFIADVENGRKVYQDGKWIGEGEQAATNSVEKAE